MNIKILIVLIVLIGLGIGGFFVYKNKEKVIPQAYQLNIPRVFTGEVLKEKETE